MLGQLRGLIQAPGRHWGAWLLWREKAPDGPEIIKLTRGHTRDFRHRRTGRGQVGLRLNWQTSGKALLSEPSPSPQCWARRPGLPCGTLRPGCPRQGRPRFPGVLPTQAARARRPSNPQQRTADPGPGRRRTPRRVSRVHRSGPRARPAPPHSPAVAPHPHFGPAPRARPLGAVRRPVPVPDHVSAAAARLSALPDSKRPPPALAEHALSRGPHQPRATNEERRPARAGAPPPRSAPPIAGAAGRALPLRAANGEPASSQGSHLTAKAGQGHVGPFPPPPPPG